MKRLHRAGPLGDQLIVPFYYIVATQVIQGYLSSYCSYFTLKISYSRHLNTI